MSAAAVTRGDDHYIVVVCDWCQDLLCEPEGTEYYYPEELDEAIRRNGWHTGQPRGIRCDMCAACWEETKQEDEP